MYIGDPSLTEKLASIFEWTKDQITTKQNG